ncbi:transposase [Petroclostridium sp. X23]|uniref:transposase n=1 Tax=Petroclostridium sp. X23 TaxID=3045146 RepID=UPI0024ACAA77|nr:transposase [Petroclostridium sp. X23]WHH57932.1 transposase [Petroclostridium sp. X23]
MSRETRERSQSGVYHVMVRGINQQDIFYDEEDYLRYLETVHRVKKEKELEIYGYCLMSNHVHLLIKEGEEGLSLAMKCIGTGYARWYNWKYHRVGHVFQGRYKSECVEDDAYLLTVIRYIHNNPVKANLIKKSEEWRWNSCRSYYGMLEYPTGLSDTAFILGTFSNDKDTAISLFKEYMQESDNAVCLDINESKRKTDNEVLREIMKIIDGNADSIHNMSKPERDKIIRAAKAIEGATHRQIARILGISPSVVFKV